jgi:uncharacterized membrane protein YiaA
MRFIGFILGVMTTVIGFYLGGYDFNERGYVAVNLYVCAIAFGILGAVFASNFED